MFMKLTSSDDRKLLLNTNFIVEVVESDGENEDVNTVLFTPFQGRTFEVQETFEEIEELLANEES